MTNIKLALSDAGQTVTVTGNGFELTFDKTTGTFSKMESNGISLLQAGGGPRLHLWRAPHRKDDMWADPDWRKAGLRNLKWTVSKVTTNQTAGGPVFISAALQGEGTNNFTVTHNVIYIISADGNITIANTVTSSDPKLAIARVGVRLFLNKQLDQFSYFGRGPMENYSDRKTGSDVGIYSSTVKEQVDRVLKSLHKKTCSR
jgi:beta-galactosidase